MSKAWRSRDFTLYVCDKEANDPNLALVIEAALKDAFGSDNLVSVHLREVSDD